MRLVIQYQGIEETIQRISEIEDRAQQNIMSQAKAIADDGKSAWKQGTPEGKTGRLRGDEDATPVDMSVIFTSPTYYYKFVDEGHRIRKRNGEYAAHRVKGRDITPKLVDWLRQNMTMYLSKFLDNV